MGGDIEVDPNPNEEFKVPKNPLKRKMSEGERMETESVESSGVESSASDILPKLSKPAFPPIKREKLADGTEVRKIPVPSHRYSPLKENWMKIFEPIVQHLKLQIRFNLKTRNVEIRTCKDTEDVTLIQKASDFVKAFIYGFEVEDVKTLKGDHLARAVGRLAGKGGRTKYTVENVTKTRIILAETKIHILGSYANIQIAKRAICNLILGSPPSKVYGTLRTVAARSSERF